MERDSASARVQSAVDRDGSSLAELFANDVSGDRLAADLAAAVSALRRGLSRRTSADWSLEQLSHAQGELLLAVERSPGMSVREAAVYLNLAANSVSTLIRRLTDRGLLTRRPDESDRRVARLYLTGEATVLFRRWRSRRAHILHEALDRLEPDEHEALVAAIPALRALTRSLDA